MLHRFAGRREHHVFLPVRPAAVTVVESAVVRRDDEEPLVEETALFADVPDPADIAVGRADLGEVAFRAVAVVVARAIHAVELDKEEGGFVLLKPGAHLIRQGGVVPRVLIDPEALFDDPDVDGIPVAEGGEGDVGHVLPDHPEGGGSGGVLHRVGNVADDGIGQSVHFGRDAEEHGAPALGADGGIGGQDVIGHRSVSEDLVEPGRFGLAEEGTRAVHADDEDMFVSHDCTPFKSGRKQAVRPYDTGKRRKSQEAGEKPSRFCSRFPAERAAREKIPAVKSTPRRAPDESSRISRG